MEMQMGLRCIQVGLSEIKFSQDETEVLVAYSLGSCVGVVLWDPEYRVGGMAYVFLPYSRAAANREPLGKSHEAAGPLSFGGGIEPGDGIELGDGIETHVRRTRPAPVPGGNGEPPGKYGEAAVKYLVARMLGLGCRRENLAAAIAGGASVIKGLSPPFGDIGSLNSQVVESTLIKERIRIAGKDTGGNHGRTVRLYIGSGKVTVSTIHHSEIEL